MDTKWVNNNIIKQLGADVASRCIHQARSGRPGLACTMQTPRSHMYMCVHKSNINTYTRLKTTFIKILIEVIIAELFKKNNSIPTY